MKESLTIDEQTVSYIKSLGIDMINKANSGHPGIVLGAAPILYSLYAYHLNISLADENWINRDRFVLSAGHGSALLYAILYMAGIGVKLEDLKNFRRVGYKTPGHPENFITPGVEATTGPLGQGVATAVGMALASKINQERFKFNNRSLIDHDVYVLVGDGDLMEGISYEAMSFAGAHNLNNLIMLYDSNDISLDGELKNTFSENIKDRCNSMNFDYFLVSEGRDITAINKAIDRAKKSSKPSLIEIKTVIGYGSILAGTSNVHGQVLDKDDVVQLKKKLNIVDEDFVVPDKIKKEFQTKIKNRVINKYEEWNNIYREILDKKYDGNLEEYKKAISNNNLYDVNTMEFNINLKEKDATRNINGKIMIELAKRVPALIGGSADLSSSTKTYLFKEADVTPTNFNGKNIWYGVREHAMGAITNGLALSGFRPFCSTFLAFSDYLKPSIRLAAIMNIPSIFIFSHDSINIGADGPTHQPIEQLAMLRSIPNLKVYRPADYNELIGSWDSILKNEGPSCLILSRDEIKQLSVTNKYGVHLGAYVIKKEFDKIDGILMATGSELYTAVNIANDLYRERNLSIRVVSVPSLDQFLEQDIKYQEALLPMGYKKFVIEAGSSYGWHRFVYNEKYLMTIDKFGISGTKDEVLKYCEFDYETIKKKINNLL